MSERDAPREPPPPPPSSPDGASRPRRSTAAVWIALALLVVLLGVAALALTAPDDGGGGTTSTGSPAIPAIPVSIDGPPRTEPLAQGSSVPDWSAPTLEGEAFEWRDRPAGPAVLAIWAPWCPHCQAELPRLSAAIERHPGVSLVTITTAVDAAEGPTPQEYLDSEGLDFLVAIDDEQGTLAAGLGVVGFPTTYFVDPSGVVLGAVAGELDPDGLEQVLSSLEGLEAA